MGCDIHLYVERRENGRWVSADIWTPNKYAKYEGEPPVAVEYENRVYTGRNYDLFGILANVRNGRGFAGIKTGEGFNPISPPRGLPEDVSPEVKAESDRWGVDGHSHSHFTVAELDAYDWHQTTRHEGVVDALNFYIWRAEGKPRAWSGDVTGTRVTHISNEEMARRIDDGWAEGCYTRVMWQEPYHISADKFYTTTLPRLREMGAPEGVRIVFWFDN